MKIETIKESGKKAIVELLNKQLQVEYAKILNYPRIIDKLIIVDKINDEQLNKDLERLGRDSTRHLGSLGELIIQLGGKPFWVIDVVDRLVDVDNLLDHQLKKEKLALSLCQEAKREAEKNKVKVQVRDFFGRLIRMEDELPYDVVNASDVISTLDRIIIDEQRHIKLVHNSIATLNMLMNK
jgi:bacterioferritin (cytochrome b1)